MDDVNGADCNGKSFRCIDPGSYVRCDDDAVEPVICADDTICHDGADVPCTPIETESPSQSETDPIETANEPESTATPNEPSDENKPDDGSNGGAESSSESSNSNGDESNADSNSSGESTEPSTGNEASPSGENESSSEPSETSSESSDVNDDENAGNEDSGAESTSENTNANDGESNTAANSSSENGAEANTDPADSNNGEATTSGDNEVTSQSSTSADDSTTTAEEQTTTPEFTCTAVGRFPHPTDCQKYNFCWDLEHPYVTFSCKSSHAYNPLYGRCGNDWSACLNAPECVANHQVLADPNDNRFYFLCKNDGSLLLPHFTIHKKQCDKHSSFDPELLVCVYNETDDGESSESNEHSEKVKFECTEAGIFPDLTDETRYYECIVKNIVKGKLKTQHHKCPKHHVFSLLDQLCIPEVAEMVEDRSNE